MWKPMCRKWMCGNRTHIHFLHIGFHTLGGVHTHPLPLGGFHTHTYPLPTHPLPTHRLPHISTPPRRRPHTYTSTSYTSASTHIHFPSAASTSSAAFTSSFASFVSFLSGLFLLCFLCSLILRPHRASIAYLPVSLAALPQSTGATTFCYPRLVPHTLISNVFFVTPQTKPLLIMRPAQILCKATSCGHWITLFRIQSG